MITAIDTNVLLDVLLPNDDFCDAAIAAIEESLTAGSLVVCDVVYAELCVHFSAQPDCDDFLAANQIRVEALTRASQFAASRVWREYRRHVSFPGTAGSTKSCSPRSSWSILAGARVPIRYSWRCLLSNVLQSTGIISSSLEGISTINEMKICPC
jgi:predicted nucleic acid-binding protein